MARVTVENCLKNVHNRFELVMIAAKRAHQLNAGTHSSLLNTEKDKASVVALREIEEGLIDASILNSADSYYNNNTNNMSEIEAELNNTTLDQKTDELSEIP